MIRDPNLAQRSAAPPYRPGCSTRILQGAAEQRDALAQHPPTNAITAVGASLLWFVSCADIYSGLSSFLSTETAACSSAVISASGPHAPSSELETSAKVTSAPG